MSLRVATGLILAALVAQVACAQECTIHVDPTMSLAEVAERAPEGAVLCLAPGIYPANLGINKAITLRGGGEQASDVSIIGAEDGPVIDVVSDPSEEVLIENLMISFATGQSDGIGLVVRGNARVELRAAIVRDCSSHGILVREEGVLSMEDCRIQRNGLSSGHDGLCLDDHASATAVDCIILENRDDGVHVTSESTVRLESCDISRNQGPALDISDSARAELLSCTMTRNGRIALELYGSSITTIVGCTITRTDGDGIHLRDLANLHMEDTTVRSSTGVGILACCSECDAWDCSTDRRWRGELTGSGNSIVGNQGKNLCPRWLEFQGQST